MRSFCIISDNEQWQENHFFLCQVLHVDFPSVLTKMNIYDLVLQKNESFSLVSNVRQSIMKQVFGSAWVNFTFLAVRFGQWGMRWREYVGRRTKRETIIIVLTCGWIWRCRLRLIGCLMSRFTVGLENDSQAHLSQSSSPSFTIICFLTVTKNLPQVFHDMRSKSLQSLLWTMFSLYSFDPNWRSLRESWDLS